MACRGVSGDCEPTIRGRGREGPGVAGRVVVLTGLGSSRDVLVLCERSSHAATAGVPMCRHGVQRQQPPHLPTQVRWALKGGAAASGSRVGRGHGGPSHCLRRFTPTESRGKGAAGHDPSHSGCVYRLSALFRNNFPVPHPRAVREPHVPVRKQDPSINLMSAPHPTPLISRVMRSSQGLT